MVTAHRIVLAALVLLAAALTGFADDGAVLLLSCAPAPDADTEDLLLGHEDLWEAAPEQPLHLNRTPPLYADGPYDDGDRPEAMVRTYRLGDGSIMVRVRWADATDDRGPEATKHPDGGEEHTYKADSEAIHTFGDAVCVMAPQARGPHETYPSMMMGDDAEPVDLYYWRAGQGFMTLSSHGRAKTEKTPDGVVIGTAERLEDGWSVVVLLPDITPGTPLCFAIWDGAKEHRDGIKYFSLWYEAQ